MSSNLEHIGLKLPPEILGTQLLEVPGDAEPRVFYVDVDGAERLDRLRHGCVQSRAFGHIALERERLGAFLRERFLNFEEAIKAPRGKGQARAFGRERVRQGFANARGCACYEHGLALKALRHGFPLSDAPRARAISYVLCGTRACQPKWDCPARRTTMPRRP